jgi:YidC/Oxa1 family membrane protein insertase
MYMVIANIFQTLQTYILSREPLPENLQKLVEEEEKKSEGREALPFEPGRSKKDGEEPKKPQPNSKAASAKSNPNANQSTANKSAANAKTTSTSSKKEAKKNSGRAKK